MYPIKWYREQPSPYHYFILNILQTLRRPGARVWSKIDHPISETEKISLPEVAAKPMPKELYKKSRLSELALVVDTKGRYKGE